MGITSAEVGVGMVLATEQVDLRMAMIPLLQKASISLQISQHLQTKTVLLLRMYPLEHPTTTPNHHITSLFLHISVFH